MQTQDLLYIYLYSDGGGNLYAKFGVCFKLSFITTNMDKCLQKTIDMDNLDTNLDGYFILSFVVVQAANLDANLGDTL